MDRGSPPALSVIIASYQGRRTISSCLASLEDQDTERAYEVVLVESSGDGTVDLVRQHFPWVRVIASRDRLFAGHARNLALERTRAPLIAFVDADCTVGPDWVSAVIDAHRSPHLLVGGVIENARPESLLAWGYYFCEFNLWLPGRGPREIDEIAGCCLSMKREAYDRYGPFLEGTYSSDTAFQWRLRADGHRVLREPAIRVLHDGRMPLRSFLGHVLQHRRQFARVRASERRFGLPARIGLALASLALPPALLAVITLRVLRSGRLVGRLTLAAPVVCAGVAARTLGEILGYVDILPRGVASDARPGRA